MRTDTTKLATIEEVRKVLRKGKKFYTSSDFPFMQMDGFYLTYKAKVMNEYLRKRGFLIVKAKEIGLSKSNEKHSIRSNRNIWISATNYINYKMRTHEKSFNKNCNSLINHSVNDYDNYRYVYFRNSI